MKRLMFVEKKLPAAGQVLESQGERSGLRMKDAVDTLKTGRFGQLLGKAPEREEEQADECKENG